MKNTNKNTIKTAVAMILAVFSITMSMLLAGCEDNSTATPDQVQSSQSTDSTIAGETTQNSTTVSSQSITPTTSNTNNGKTQSPTETEKSKSINNADEGSSGNTGNSSSEKNNHSISSQSNSSSSSGSNKSNTNDHSSKTYHEAVYNIVHHPAEYKNVYVVDQESYSYDEPVYDNREYTICHVCGAEFDTTNGPSAFFAHDDQHLLAGEGSGYHSVIREVQTGTKTVTVPEEGHYENQLVKEAYDEKVLIREAGWY